MFQNYGLIVYWDIGEECFVAASSEMLVCRGTGSTRQEAVIAFEQEMEGWRKTQQAVGWSGSTSGQQETEMLPVTEPERKITVSQPEANTRREEVVREIVAGDAKLEIRVDGRKPIIYLNGEINIYTVPGLTIAIDQLTALGTNNLLIDLTAVNYADSSFYGALISVRRKLRHKNGAEGKLLLAGPNNSIARMLQITRLDTVFMVHETLQDAETTLAELEEKGLGEQPQFHSRRLFD